MPSDGPAKINEDIESDLGLFQSMKLAEGAYRPNRPLASDRSNGAPHEIEELCNFSGNPSLAPTISSPDDADKTIVIHDATNHVTVFANETVLFKLGDQQFAIKFDGVSRAYDLAKLAPAGMLNHKIRVYVAPSPVGRGQGIM